MHANPLSLRSCALSLLLLLCTPLKAADDNGGREALFVLINERLSVMEQVALYKYRNKVAVEDLERERQVIENSTLGAARRGLDPESIEAFFAAQIAVAKAIQYRHLADWQSAPNPEQAPDLANRIRPALNELGDRIIDSLALLLQSGERIDEQHRQVFLEAMTVEKVSDSDKTLLFESLAAVKAGQAAR